MKRAALVIIAFALAAVVSASDPAAQSLQSKAPPIEPEELEDGWVQHRSAGFEIEIPQGYMFVDVTAPDVEYRRERLLRQWPAAKDMLDDQQLMKDVVLVGVDRDTMRSRFVDHFLVLKTAPTDWTREQADSKAAVEQLQAKIVAKATAAGELFEVEVFEWRAGEMAVRKKTTRTERSPRGYYLKLISLETWLLAYPNVWYVTFNTVTEREESVRHLVSRAALSLVPLAPEFPPVKLVARTAGDVTLMLPEGFELVALTSNPNPQLDRVLELYPSARPLIEKYTESKRVALGFDPRTLDGGNTTTIGFARYPLPNGAPHELRSAAYVQQCVTQLREQWEKQGFRTDGIQLFPIGDDGPVYRYDYSSAPAADGGERIMRRQLAYFVPPVMWLVTFTLRESQGRAVDRYLADVAASFAPLDLAAAPTLGGSAR